MLLIKYLNAYEKCLFLMLMFVSVVMAQEPYKVFCELLGTAKLFSTKLLYS